MKPVHYGVQIEFTVDNVLDGGPSRADIRRYVRDAVMAWRGQFLGEQQERFSSLKDVRIRYLHEATEPRSPR